MPHRLPGASESAFSLDLQGIQGRRDPGIPGKIGLTFQGHRKVIQELDPSEGRQRPQAELPALEQ